MDITFIDKKDVRTTLRKMREGGMDFLRELIGMDWGEEGLGVIYISALIGGFVSVRQNKKDALLCGIVSGAMLALCFFVISLFFADGSSSYSFLIELILRGAMLLMSVFGAFAGLNRGNKRRGRR